MLSTPVPARADDAELRRRGEQIRGDLGRAADEQPVGVRQSGGEIRRRLRPVLASTCQPLRAEQFERRLRQVVGDDDLQCDLGVLGPRVRK